MLQKLANGKVFKATAEERKAFLDTAWWMVRRYGWGDKVVYPFDAPLYVAGILVDLEEIDGYKPETQELIIETANRLAETLNGWMEKELEELIDARIRATGAVVKIRYCDLDKFGDLVDTI